jgi:hypothetical protein
MKKDKLIAVVDLYQPQIVGISETWYEEETSDVELAIAGYNIFIRVLSHKEKEAGVLYVL